MEKADFVWDLIDELGPWSCALSSYHLHRPLFQQRKKRSFLVSAEKETVVFGFSRERNGTVQHK